MNDVMGAGCHREPCRTFFIPESISTLEQWERPLSLPPHRGCDGCAFIAVPVRRNNDMNTAVVTVKIPKDSCALDISRRGAQKRCYRSIIRTEPARGAMQSRGES